MQARFSFLLSGDVLGVSGIEEEEEASTSLPNILCTLQTP